MEITKDALRTNWGDHVTDEEYSAVPAHDEDGR
jgi:hypothetical protein